MSDEHLTDEALARLYEDARRILGPRPRVGWRHRKSGHLYEVDGVYLREADLVPMVAYCRATILSGPRWVRSLAEFMERFYRDETVYELP